MPEYSNQNLRIGIYIEDLPAIDCSNPHLGNMGVGGTQFCMLLLIYYLKRSKKVLINVYCATNAILPFSVKPFIVKDGTEAVLKSKENCDSFLIMKNPQAGSSTYHIISKVKHKIIIWCHNYILADYADYLSKISAVAAVVFVGKQLYDRYIDHDIIKKSTFIYNIVPDPEPLFLERKLNKSVVYMGALIYVKGFHILASMWKDILKKVPDAELFVMGSGCLYSRGEKVGKYGIADEAYENLFMRYLLDDKGNILPSVHFMGIVGQEKYKIFEEASVGVVNPSGRTETFGMGIVEMNSAYLPVVTINHNGYPDTIKSGINGYLCKRKKTIKDRIVYLLTHPSENIKLGINGKKLVQNYSGDVIISYWYRLFEAVKKNNKSYFSYKPASPPYTNNFKFLRIIFRFIRNDLHIKIIPPLIEIETQIYKFLTRKH